MKKSLLYLLLFVAANVVGGVVAILLSNIEPLLNGAPIDATGLTVDGRSIGVATFWAYVLLVALMAVLRLTPHWRTLLPRRGGWRAEISALLAVVLLAYALTFLLAPLNLSDGGMMAHFESMKTSVLCVCLITVLGPLVEELVFRAGVLHSLLQRRWHPLPAILMTAAVFAIVHGNLMQALPAFVSGTLLGVYYYRSGGLRLPLMAHILNNTLAALAMYFPWLEGYPAERTLAEQLTAGFLLLSASLLCVGRWWVLTAKSTDEIDKNRNDEDRND